MCLGLILRILQILVNNSTLCTTLGVLNLFLVKSGVKHHDRNQYPQEKGTEKCYRTAMAF